MFVLREIAVSLAFFVLLYSLLSAIVTLAWRPLKRLHTTQRSLADLLFATRVLPLVASIALTLAFVLPSFQLLEPRSIDEGIGAIPIVLGVCALFLIACGCFRVIAAQRKTSRVVARWLEGAHPLALDATSRSDGRIRPSASGAGSGSNVITLRSRRESPPLILVGVCRPRVLVSDSAVALLTPDELRIALQHERAHMHSRDNFKKLIFRLCPFPGMTKLENAWSQIAELAADDAAVAKLADAVNLAAALVKLARLVPLEPVPVCTVGFVTGSITSRVARLLAWDKFGTRRPAPLSAPHTIVPLVVSLICVVTTYGPVLALTHEVTEWLVR